MGFDVKENKNGFYKSKFNSNKFQQLFGFTKKKFDFGTQETPGQETPSEIGKNDDEGVLCAKDATCFDYKFTCDECCSKGNVNNGTESCWTGPYTHERCCMSEPPKEDPNEGCVDMKDTECFDDTYTCEECCSKGSVNNGTDSCWTGPYTHERCCNSEPPQEDLTPENLILEDPNEGCIQMKDPTCFDAKFTCTSCCETDQTPEGNECWSNKYLKSNCCKTEEEIQSESPETPQYDDNFDYMNDKCIDEYTTSWCQGELESGARVCDAAMKNICKKSCNACDLVPLGKVNGVPLCTSIWAQIGENKDEWLPGCIGDRNEFKSGLGPFHDIGPSESFPCEWFAKDVFTHRDYVDGNNEKDTVENERNRQCKRDASDDDWVFNPNSFTINGNEDPQKHRFNPLKKKAAWERSEYAMAMHVCSECDQCTDIVGQEKCVLKGFVDETGYQHSDKMFYRKVPREPPSEDRWVEDPNCVGESCSKINMKNLIWPKGSLKSEDGDGALGPDDGFICYIDKDCKDQHSDPDFCFEWEPNCGKIGYGTNDMNCRKTCGLCPKSFRENRKDPECKDLNLPWDPQYCSKLEHLCKKNIDFDILAYDHYFYKLNNVLCRETCETCQADQSCAKDTRCFFWDGRPPDDEGGDFTCDKCCAAVDATYTVVEADELGRERIAEQSCWYHGQNIAYNDNTFTKERCCAKPPTKTLAELAREKTLAQLAMESP